jgi:hypothetical protein
VPTWQGCWNVSESVRSRPGHRSPFGDRDGKRSRNTSSIAELRTSAGLRSGAKRRPAWHTGFDRSRALPPKHADDRYHAARGRPLACSWFRVRTGGRAGSRPRPRLRRLKSLPPAEIVPSVNGRS